VAATAHSGGGRGGGARSRGQCSDRGGSRLSAINFVIPRHSGGGVAAAHGGGVAATAVFHGGWRRHRLPHPSVSFAPAIALVSILLA
jgi:hypothetical protein